MKIDKLIRHSVHSSDLLSRSTYNELISVLKAYDQRKKAQIAELTRKIALINDTVELIQNGNIEDINKALDDNQNQIHYLKTYIGKLKEEKQSLIREICNLQSTADSYKKT